MGFQWATKIENNKITKDNIKEIYEKIDSLYDLLLLTNKPSKLKTEIGITIHEYNNIVKAVDNMLDNNYCRMHNTTDYIEYKSTYDSNYKNGDNLNHLVSDKATNYLTNNVLHKVSNCPSNCNSVNSTYTPASYSTEVAACKTHYVSDKFTHKASNNLTHYTSDKSFENAFYYSLDNITFQSTHNYGVKTSHYIANNGSDYKGDNSTHDSSIKSVANSLVNNPFTLIRVV